MENNINNKKNSNSMDKKITILSIITLLVMSFSLSSIYAEDQHELMRYQFEEGTGGIILDSSGNGYHGVRSGGGWTTSNKWGAYAFYLDGVNDYISTITSEYSPPIRMVSMWLDVDYGTGKEVITNIHGTIENYIVYIDYTDGGKIKIDLVNENQVIDTYTFVEETVSAGYEHYVFGINAIDNHLCAWKNGVSTCYLNLTNGIYSDNSLKNLRIGSDEAELYNYYDGYIDEFRMFDFILNSSQVNSLMTTNTINLKTDVAEEPTSTMVTNIINSTYPHDNTNITKDESIDVTLNIKASCDLYIDNVLVEHFEDTLAFNYGTGALDIGSHEYFVYCENVDLNSNEMSYELTQVYHFELKPYAPSTVSFQIIGVDFDTNEHELWVTTPCIERGMSVRYIDETRPFLPKFNADGIYFAKVENGFATMEVPEKINKYCLYNGNIIVNGVGKTDNYDPVKIYGEITLGSIETPNNNTDTFIIRLEQFDIYNIFNPKAWGESWTTIIGTLILFITGIVTLIYGNNSDNGKISLAGVMLILASMGIGMGNLFTGVIF